MDHFLAAKRIICYVKDTIYLGLTFHLSTAPGALIAYSDIDWVDCPDTHCFTSGYSSYFGSNLIYWSSKKQHNASHSSCEFEYCALAITPVELLKLIHLLRDLWVPVSQRPLLLYDNKSAIFLSSNPIS